MTAVKYAFAPGDWVLRGEALAQVKAVYHLGHSPVFDLVAYSIKGERLGRLQGEEDGIGPQSFRGGCAFQ